MASFTTEFHKQHSRKITDLIKDWAIDLLCAQIQAFARAFPQKCIFISEAAATENLNRSAKLG